HQPLDADQRVGSALGENGRWTAGCYIAVFFAFRHHWAAHRRRLRAKSGNGFKFDALVRIGHDLVPGHCRERATGHLVHDLVVVVAEPDAADHVAGEPYEPGVAVSVGGAGLPCRLDAVEDGAPRGAFLHDFAHHHVHIHGDLRREHLYRFFAVAVPTPDQLTGATADFEDRMRRHRLAEVGEDRVGTGVIEYGHFICPDRHRRRIRKRRAQPRLAREVPDLGAPDFRIPVTERDR